MRRRFFFGKSRSRGSNIPGTLLDAFTNDENEQTVVYGISRAEWLVATAYDGGERAVEKFDCVTLREQPGLRDTAAEWFHSKWGVPREAYLQCMTAYLNGETEYGWYLCLCGDRIIGGLGVIENDFHPRKDFAPNLCAVYTEREYRGRGIAGRLLTMAASDLKDKGISPVYLLTDHIGFYERYGWEFLCEVCDDGETKPSRMYVRR